MAALTDDLRQDIRTSADGLPPQQSYVVESAAILYHRAIVGIHDGLGANSAKQGQIAPFDPTVEGLRYAGIHFGDQITGDGSKRSTLAQSGMRITRVTVAGSGSSLPLTPVYAQNDNLDDLNVNGNGGQDDEPIGYLVYQSGGAASTVWDIQTFDVLQNAIRGLKRSRGADQRIASTHALVTADGAISKATLFNGAVIYLRGGTSAVMTLAVPTAAEVGQSWNFKRSAGTGVHSIAYTDELGQAVVAVLGDGDVCTLQAFSTTGYRRLA